LRAQESDVPVVVITAHGTIETAVTAMKHGACDYILRPFDIDVLELAVQRALNGAEVARQNSFLKQEINRGWDAFIGTSQPMRSVYDLIQRVGPSKASVLITGETGTGKELAARAVHNASPRRDKLFVPINCAAIPADILESELFGYEKGAFTGAVKERVGKFELADGGTIFLDELTEMPMALQAKLLRVLQENTIERLGGNRVINLDIRVIAATNRDPLEGVRDGKLREDLYYRVNVFSIELPPLRQRTADIAGLVEHFIVKHGYSTADTRLAPGALERLAAYGWPGNVRELENMVERALILSGGGLLDEQHFMLTPRGAAPRPQPSVPPADGAKPPPPLNQAVEDLEARLIDEALAQSEGNKAKAAALLDISERTLWYKLKKYRPDQENS
jgi:two-component system response regulator AtoC